MSSQWTYGFECFGVNTSSTETLFHLRLLVLRDSNQPVKCNRSNHVENTENPRQAEVSPSVTKLNVQTSEEAVGVRDWTVLALSVVGSSWIENGPAYGSDVPFEILAASASAGYYKFDNLLRGAAHGCVC
jgi:hypothetical protein